MASFMICPTAVKFESHQLQRLEQYLEETETNTEVRPVAEAEELLITSLGRTMSGSYRLAAPAVSAICRRACPGLFKTIASLSGFTLDENRSPHPLTAELVYNRTVRARFDETLSDRYAIFDIKHNQIDGIIGASYQYLSNNKFFGMVRDTILHSTKPLKFDEAHIIGRTMIVTYVQGVSLVDKPHRYYPGLCFVNSELGDHSVRALRIIVQDKTKYRASVSAREGRTIHTGKEFNTRVARSLQSHVNDENETEGRRQRQLSKGISDLTTINLGFKGLDFKHSRERADDLITRLVRRKVGNQHAERIVYTALNCGANSTTSQWTADESTKKNMWGTRTAYDLFVALIRDAANRPLSYRLALERAAYELALGKFALVKK